MSSHHELIFLHLDEVGSTNDAARDALLSSGRAHWVTADRQRAGRGRRNRPWESPPGNLYASHAFLSRFEPVVEGFLPLAMAVALAEAVAAAFRLEAALKWPNDLLIAGGKTAGILVEAEPHARGRLVVVGFGVNVTSAPAGATHLAAHAPHATAPALLAALVDAVAEVCKTLAGPDGLAHMRERWLARAVGIGGPVTVRFDVGSCEGTFLGLDPAGRLILGDGEGGTQLVAAGDVFMRGAQ